MKKRILSLIMSVVMIITMFAGLEISSVAEEDILSYLTYEIVDGEVIITDCDTSIIGDIIIPDTIEGYPVTAIGNGAFRDCTILTGITIRNNVTVIDDWAFCGCSCLVNISISESVTTIGYSAFEKCNALKNITIPDSVTDIGSFAFDSCDNLTSVKLSDNITIIKDGMFDSCKKLSDITIPDGITSINRYAFRYCDSLTSITIPDSVTTIQSDAFFDSDSLTSINIPKSVSGIGDEAFSSCDSLASITVEPENQYFSSDEYGVLFNKTKTQLIQYPSGNERTEYIVPDGVMSIGVSAFNNSHKLKNVIISDSVIHIADSVFSSCYDLTDVYYSGSEEDWNNISVGDWNYYLQDAKIHYNTNTNHYESVVTPPTCTERGYTTYTCSCGYSYESDYVESLGHKYTTVVTPPTCTNRGYTTYSCHCGYSYKSDYVESLGHKYTTVVTPPTCTERGYTTYTCHCGYSYESDYVDELGGEHVFSEGSEYCDICSAYFLTYKINNGEVVITDCATTFSDNIIIPDTIEGYPVTLIGQSKIYRMVNLKSIVIPKSIKLIEDRTFFQWSFYLTDIYYSGSEEDWNNIYEGDSYSLEDVNMHYNTNANHYTGVVTSPTCTERGYTTYTCPCGYSYKTDYVNALGGEHVFSDGSEYCDICSEYFLSYEINDGEVTITDCDESISGDVVIPNTIEGYPVTAIGENAFSYFDNITSVVIPNSVTIIGEGAFWFCKNLVSVVVPNSMISIADGAFDWCYGLTDVYYSGSEEDCNNISIGESNYYLERAKIHYNTNTNHYESVVTPPTCEESGYTTYTCPCGYSYYSDYVDSTGHDYSAVVFAPTCTEVGYTVYSCICGDNYTSDYVEPIGNGHVFTDGSEYCDVCSEYFLTYNIENEEVVITGCDSTVNGEIIIPDKIEGYPVTEIYSGAFYGCSDITTFILSENIKTIGESVFNNCSGIEKIVVSKDNKYYSSDEHGVLFNKDKTELIYYPDSNPASEYEIPESVKIIGDSAFYNCSYIEKIVIPSGVTSIGYSAFGWCDRLKELHVPETVESLNWTAVAWSRSLEKIIIDENNPYYSSDEYGVVYNKDRTSLIIYPENGNAEYVIPKTVRKINDYAFWWSDCLEKITIPDSVTIIGEYAFFDCDNLKSVTIPESVRVIGANALGLYGEDGSDEISLVDGFEIKGAVGSEAEIYARKKGLSFVEINKNTSTTEPTTKEPETEVPTTEPTTKAPETEIPTTEPTTKEPETEVPTTEPTTKEPETEPTTKEPVTQAPTTEKPSERPTEKPTEAPTQKPVSDKLEVKDDTVKVDNTSKVSTVKTKSSANDILKAVKNEKVSIIDKDGNAVSGDALVGTGAKIQIKDNNGKVINTYTVCVPTDVDGNGKTTAADARLALRGSAKLEKVEGVYASASDMNSDGKITAADARKILRISAGLEKL